MTNDEKSAAIAKADGWKLGRSIGKTHIEASQWWKEGEPPRWLPEYFHDLNAMHAVIGTLTYAQKCDIDTELQRMEHEKSLTWRWHATAAQLAECFGRTLKLWT